MNKVKLVGISWIVILVITLSPIPLSFIDLTFHWLLLVTLPIGGLLLIILGIIWLVMKGKQTDKQNENKSDLL